MPWKYTLEVLLGDSISSQKVAEVIEVNGPLIERIRDYADGMGKDDMISRTCNLRQGRNPFCLAMWEWGFCLPHGRTWLLQLDDYGYGGRASTHTEENIITSALSTSTWCYPLTNQSQDRIQGDAPAVVVAEAWKSLQAESCLQTRWSAEPSHRPPTGAPLEHMMPTEVLQDPSSFDYPRWVRQVTGPLIPIGPGPCHPPLLV